MASPFSSFRKNQKVYLAILGVVLMIAFVFGGVTCSNQDPARQGTVVASTKYGDLSESQMGRLREDMELLSRFPVSLLSTLIDKPPQVATLPEISRSQIIQRQLTMSGLLTGDSETSAVDMMIMARKAEELGLVVSNDAINEFISRQTNQQLTN